MYLNSIDNINTALAAYRNNKDIRPEKFYSRILLDTIELPMEDYVHVQHATKTHTLPADHQKVVLNRFGSWTAHTELLKEMIPPRPDQTRSESIELYTLQFGRVAYFSSQLKTDVIGQFEAHYAKRMSDLANQTIEKYAREKLLSAPAKFYAGSKLSIGDLVPGDTISVADLRLLVLRFQRLMVDPLNGFYNYICSPEFIYDLIDDPYVQSYMEINQSTFDAYTNGKPFPLFQVRYIPTRFDENLAPDLDHPGEYIDASNTFWNRRATKDGKIIFSVKATNTGTFANEVDVIQTSHLAGRYTLTEYYYRDGSAIENRIYWKINKDVAPVAYHATAANINVENVYIGTERYTDTGVKVMDYEKLPATIDDGGSEVINPEIADLLTADVIGSSVELPVNKGILVGGDGLVKVISQGLGNAEIIMKAAGSAGALDPLNQLSSMGFKLRGLGFGFERVESVVITYGVPNQALTTAGIYAGVVLSYATGEQVSRNVNPVPETGNVKNGNYQGGAAWVTATKYKAGDRFTNGGNQFVAVVDHTASAALDTDVLAGKVVKLGTVLVNNPTDLGIKKKDKE